MELSKVTAAPRATTAAATAAAAAAVATGTGATAGIMLATRANRRAVTAGGWSSVVGR